MELINKSLNERLDEIVTKGFEINRLLDRGCSLLAVKFKMLKTASLLHEQLAHAFPKLADLVSDFQGSRGMLTDYGATPAGEFDAESHIELFTMFQDEFFKFQDLIEDAIDNAILEKDYAVKVFLEEYLLKFNPYIETVCNLVDIASDYGTETMAIQLFDNEVEHCLTISIVEEADVCVGRKQQRII